MIVMVDDELRVEASMTGSGRLSMRLVGDLDAATSHRLTDELGQWLGVRECIVDLSDCRFIDSNGIRALLMCHHELGPGTMRLVGANDSVERALRVSGIDGELEMGEA
jgi:anti-anti-sigma factor